MPHMNGIHHLALTVRDLKVSTVFYQRVLGFPPLTEMVGEKLTRQLFALPGGMNLGLTEHQIGLDHPFTPFQPGMDHLGFSVATHEELERWAEHLDSLEIPHSGLIEASYGTALNFQDPDAIALEFFVGT